MQEKTTIRIKPETINDIDNDHADIRSILDRYFNEHLKAVHDLLFNYHYDKRERVYDLKIANGSIVFDGSKGSFKVVYMIGFFNACADLDYNAPEKMKIDFIINKESEEVVLVGEYWPERGQDEI